MKKKRIEHMPLSNVFVCVGTIAIEFHICGAKTYVAIFIRLKFKNMCEHFDSAEKIFYVNI